MVIVSNHPGQKAYARLCAGLDRVTFLKPTPANLKESAFLEILNAKGNEHSGVLFDDVESEKIPGLQELVAVTATRLCHHIGFSAFLTVHSVFYNNDQYRLIQK